MAARQRGWSTERIHDTDTFSRLIIQGDAARDFADVYALARRFGKSVLLARAAQIDAGFDTKTLASMLATLDRFTDSEIPLPEGSSVAELRDFYSAWRSELSG